MWSAMHKKGALNRNAASLPSTHPRAHSHPLHKALARQRALLFAIQFFLLLFFSLHPHHHYIATFREQAVAFAAFS